jgi:hypothetical protein
MQTRMFLLQSWIVRETKSATLLRKITSQDAAQRFWFSHESVKEGEKEGEVLWSRWRRKVALPFLFLFLQVFSVLSEKKVLP